MDECGKCKGRGIIFLKAGIPNIVDVCPECKSHGGIVGYVSKCRMIATVAHSGHYRRDKHGNPTNEAYIHHCGRVANHFEDWPAAQAVAWLHDTIEDCPDKVSRASLEKDNIPQSVIAAVEALTKKGESYHTYLLGVKMNEIARAVKIRDMIDNLASDPTDKQIVKYSAGLAYLACDESTLRNLRSVLVL